jgi:hypothetical protein
MLHQNKAFRRKNARWAVRQRVLAPCRNSFISLPYLHIPIAQRRAHHRLTFPRRAMPLSIRFIYIYDFFTHLPARRRTAGLAIRGCRGIPALSGEAPNSLAINGSASARPRCDSTTSASGNRNRKCYGTVEGYDRDVLKFWQAWFATIAVTLLTSAVIAFDLIDDTFRGWWAARAFATDTLQESWSSSLLC